MLIIDYYMDIDIDMCVFSHNDLGQSWLGGIKCVKGVVGWLVKEVKQRDDTISTIIYLC